MTNRCGQCNFRIIFNHWNWYLGWWQQFAISTPTFQYLKDLLFAEINAHLQRELRLLFKKIAFSGSKGGKVTTVKVAGCESTATCSLTKGTNVTFDIGFISRKCSLWNSRTHMICHSITYHHVLTKSQSITFHRILAKNFQPLISSIHCFLGHRRIL